MTSAVTSGYVQLVRSNRGFRRVWLSHLISLGGDWFNTVALIGLVLDLTGSAFYTALVVMANLIPSFLLSPFAGPVADRLDRKKLIVGAHLIQVLLALGMLLVRSEATVWIGIACLLGIATLETFAQPAAGAAIPNLVRLQDLPAANALMGASWGVMLAVGAAAGGIVVTLVGRDTAFVINAASFLLSALMVARVAGRFSEDRPKTPLRPLRDALEGMQVARRDPRLFALIAAKAGFGLGFGLLVLLPVFATDVFHKGDAGIGIMYAARGVGVTVGPFLVRGFIGHSQRRLFLALGGCMALYGVMYLLFPLAPGIWPASVAVTLAHIGSGSQWILGTYGLQSLTPDEFRGRVLALDMGMAGLTMSSSGLVAGRAAETLGPQIVMLILAGVALAYCVIWTAWTRPIWRKAPTQPALSEAP